MSLKKIEDALSVLGYTGELVGFDLASEEGYCTIKLKVSKAGIDILNEEKKNVVTQKPVFGSMSNKINERETISEYIARGGVTELKKTQSAPALVKPVTQKPVKELEKRPRAWKRFIYFKSSKEANGFIDRYSSDFEVGKTKKTYWRASETRFDLRKNTSNNDLFKKGYLFVLEFSMNGVDFKALGDLENLEIYRQPGKYDGRRGGSYKSIRLYKGSEKVKVV